MRPGRLMCHLRDNEGYDISLITLVMNNAAAHSRIQEVFDEPEFTRARLLRLAPYSAPLNPIEMIWSTLKERMKSSLASVRTEVLVTLIKG